MLDDIKLIHERDPDDALGVAEKQWQQLKYDYKLKLADLGPIDNIVLAGMGGSALPAVYLGSWPELYRPLQIVRDYSIPAYVNEKTLFISSSYSGNTEETLAALEAAEAKNAKIVVISAGGKLADKAKQKGYTLLTIPGGIQPRMCSFFFLAALIQIFEPLKLVKEGSLNELQAAADWLKTEIAPLLPTVPTAKNPAKALALDLIGKSVVVYSGPKLFPAANKFKICLNENAKNVAWVNQYPEFNHNEFIGWSAQPVKKPYAVVEVRSSLENERVGKRFIVSQRLLSGKRPEPKVVTPAGDSLIKQLLWASNFGDFCSLYVAILNGINPTPVELVERLKQQLD